MSFLRSKIISFISIFCISLLVFTYSCQHSEQNKTPLESIHVPVERPASKDTIVRKQVSLKKSHYEIPRNNLKHKLNSKEAIIVQVLVPLCDNENQGIFPVPTALGNGLDPRNNLYWGALYGVKTHFKKHPNWALIKTLENVSEDIIERCIFISEREEASNIILVADAYRGDRMKDCLKDYFSYLSDTDEVAISEGGLNIKAGSQADLIILNGHNGLMDVQMPLPYKKAGKPKYTAVIGCYSFDYFSDYFMSTEAYPILSTTHLMAPEGYVMMALIESWYKVDMSTDLRNNVAAAYHQYQNCGMKGARNLFQSGW